MGFTLQGFGPFLHWLTLGIVCVMPVLAAFVIYKLGGLPGAIARSRRHPQAEAISICGWMGIITLVLWPIAMVWAYLSPAKPAGGIGQHEEHRELQDPWPRDGHRVDRPFEEIGQDELRCSRQDDQHYRDDDPGSQGRIVLGPKVGKKPP